MLKLCILRSQRHRFGHSFQFSHLMWFNLFLGLYNITTLDLLGFLPDYDFFTGHHHHLVGKLCLLFLKLLILFKGRTFWHIVLRHVIARASCRSTIIELLLISKRFRDLLFNFLIVIWRHLLCLRGGCYGSFRLERADILSLIRWPWNTSSCSRRAFPFILMHLRKVKALQVPFSLLNLLPLLLKDIFLLFLELKVCFNNPLNSAYVWITVHMESFDKLSNIMRILPLLDSLEKA